MNLKRQKNRHTHTYCFCFSFLLFCSFADLSFYIYISITFRKKKLVNDSLLKLYVSKNDVPKHTLVQFNRAWNTKTIQSLWWSHFFQCTICHLFVVDVTFFLFIDLVLFLKPSTGFSTLGYFASCIRHIIVGVNLLIFSNNKIVFCFFSKTFYEFVFCCYSVLLDVDYLFKFQLLIG